MERISRFRLNTSSTTCSNAGGGALEASNTSIMPAKASITRGSKSLSPFVVAAVMPAFVLSRTTRSLTLVVAAAVAGSMGSRSCLMMHIDENARSPCAKEAAAEYEVTSRSQPWGTNLLISARIEWSRDLDAGAAASPAGLSEIYVGCLSSQRGNVPCPGSSALSPKRRTAQRPRCRTVIRVTGSATPAGQERSTSRTGAMTWRNKLRMAKGRCNGPKQLGPTSPGGGGPRTGD